MTFFRYLAPAFVLFALPSCGRIRGTNYWDVVVRDVAGKREMTFREMPDRIKARKIEFPILSGQFPDPITYRLPEQGEAMPDTEVTFSDTTRLPGRVTLTVGNHTVDIMERILIVDGQEFMWEKE